MKTDVQMIEEMGRNIANAWLHSALEKATTTDELNAQLHTLHVACVHLLATNIFNKEKSYGESETTLIMETKESIEDELELIKSQSDLTVHEIGENNGQ